MPNIQSCTNECVTLCCVKLRLLTSTILGCMCVCAWALFHFVLNDSIQAQTVNLRLLFSLSFVTYAMIHNLGVVVFFLLREQYSWHDNFFLLQKNSSDIRYTVMPILTHIAYVRSVYRVDHKGELFYTNLPTFFINWLEFSWKIKKEIGKLPKSHKFIGIFLLK